MNTAVAQALPLWGMSRAEVRLIAQRENAVYRIDWQGQTYAMRLHRRGYRRDAELQSELDWMAAIDIAGLSVPAPVATKDGEFLVVVDDLQIDVLHWLKGVPFDLAAIPPGSPQRRDHYFKLGAQLAALHTASDAWTPKATFTRPAWDRDGLVGDAPLWGRFWKNPNLSPKQRSLLKDLSASAKQTLRDCRCDYGLIHADPVPENILVDGDTLHFIDFDDGGYGYRLFDLATALVKTIDAPDHVALQHALVQGYKSARQIDPEHLDLFMALRAATYVGWIVPRMDEVGAEARSVRFIDAACTLAKAL